MREILFRGKRTDNGEWVYGVPTKDARKETVIVESIFECDEYNCRGAECLYVDENTIGQYTGLTDKNGKKIFEGDVVKVERDLWHGENKKEREVFNGVVWYDEKHTCFGLKSKKYRCLPIARFKGDYSTVIGNVHDNPELLKGE